MKTITKITIFLSILFVSQNLLAATKYVSKTGGNVSPYTSWANAANDIQSAVDVASTGDTVLVNDGTYDTGERVTPGYSSYNRVVITKNITVKSVNGPEATIILGKGPLGSNAVRGVYMSTGILSGFTVSNGHTWTSDDYYYDISGGGINMQDGNGVVTNCTISGNSAGDRGGGAYKGTINNCTISGNSSFEGGGTCESFVNNCIICKNSAVGGGGGTFFCIVNNSTISENSTADSGGGVCGCTVNNSTIYGNSANDSGGGANSSFIYNCTICGNSACDYGGGTRECTVNNSIIWNNSAPRDANCDDSWSSYSCTTPLQSGEGNFTNNPLLISASHISPNSPCIGAGSTNYSTGVDIDGEAWKNPPSVGCDEVYTNNLTGDLQVVIFAEYTSAVIGTELEFISIIKGNPISNYWSFSDGEFYSDKCIVKHSYPTAGKYKVILSAFNLDNPAGVTATIMVNIVELKDATFYVNKANTTPVSPYKSWNTAATNIQNAVNIASQTKDSLVLVANGIYYPADQISVTKAITVKSVSGAEKTIINGSHSHRCFHLNCNAIIDGFTITNGYTSSRGGGTVGGTINNCIISGNSAGWYGGGTCKSTVNNCTISGNSAGWYGGGTCEGTINNCIISGNTAEYEGGGTYWSTINNCTISGNSATNGGGTYKGTINNCIIWDNSANVSNNFYDCTINYSCTTPLPSGEGNISRNPQFISSSDFHLKITSPCINAGTNAFAPMPYDLDSYPRIVNGIVDMGCYEANPTPPSPVFDDAETLPSNYDLADGSNTNAITEPGEPAHAGYGPFHSVWWDWKSPGNSLVLSSAKDADGDMLLVDTHGSDFDTVLAVYTGLDVSNLTEIASNDDAGPGTNTSEVVFDFIANETYHIVVAGKTESDTGNIVLHYEIIPEPLLFINCYLLFIIYYLRKLNFIKN